MSDEKSGADGNNTWWWASAAVMLVVLLGLGVVVFFPNETDSNTQGSEPNSSSQNPTPFSSPADPQGTGWEDAGCNGTPGDSQVLASAPKDADWVPLGAMSVPTSSEYGPVKVDEAPLRQCYQHSPTGAVFAAVNIMAAGGATGKWQDGAAVAEHQMTPGAARDEAMSDRSDVSGQVWSLSAFRVGGCDPMRCNVDMVLSLNGQLMQATWSLVWSEDVGDWKVDGNQQFGVSQLTSIPAGFTPWTSGM